MRATPPVVEYRQAHYNTQLLFLENQSEHFLHQPPPSPCFYLHFLPPHPQDTFLRSQLRPLPVRQQHRCGVCLESRDGLGLPSLAHHIHRLPHSHRHRQGGQVLVKCDQHAWLDGWRQEVQHVVGVAKDNCTGGGGVWLIG